MKRPSLLLIAIVLLALGSAAVARAGSSANYAIQPNAVAAGGQTASSANYTIASTAGQPAIGQGESANYSVCSGFWCQAQAALAQLFLPLVKR
jgi:hypothetical protein